MSNFWQRRTTATMAVSVIFYAAIFGGTTYLAFVTGVLEGKAYIVRPVYVELPDGGKSIDISRKFWLLGLSPIVLLPLPAILLTAFLWLLGFDIFALRSTVNMEAYGTARYATNSEKRKLHTGRDTSLIIGGRGRGKPYLFDGPEHLLTVAPTRSGKGVSVIIPNLLTANRSVICIDPKGENAQVTARRRGTFGPVHVLDPFNVSGKHNCAYNPLSGLSVYDLNFVDDTASIASALIVSAPNARDPHFDEAARALVRGLIMAVMASEPGERQNLVTLREYLTYSSERFALLLSSMAQMQEAHGAIASAANVFLGKNPKEASAILSTAQEQTNFLDSPQLRQSLIRSDMDFGSLKDRVSTVFIVLPQSRLESHGRWIRLLIARAMQDIERNRTKPPAPVLFILDEFATIGDLPVIKTAVGLMAGFGLQIWAFLQNWGQLEELYQRGAHTFAANAGVFQAFNVNDELTARYVSDLSGDATVAGRQERHLIGGPSLYETHQRKLLTPDEAMHMKDDTLFLKIKGIRPIIAEKVAYYRDRQYRGLFDQSDFN